MSAKPPDASNEIIIKNLIDLITGGNSHAGLDRALDNLTADIAGLRVDNLPYSIWQLAEHIRIAQWDILEFSRKADHTSPQWPDEYWPREVRPSNNEALIRCVEEIKKDRDEFVSLLKTPGIDLYKPFPYGEGQTLLREALVLADHNSYHTGEIIIMRRLLGNWK